MNPVISGQISKETFPVFRKYSRKQMEKQETYLSIAKYKKYKSFMKCQNLIDFSERKVYATKKKENQETGGDTDETGAKPKNP